MRTSLVIGGRHIRPRGGQSATKCYAALKAAAEEIPLSLLAILRYRCGEVMMVGQKVVCVNDTFPPAVSQFYKALPKKDQIYVIRAVMVGVNWKGEPGEVCVYLVGLVNPCSETPPYPERGFNAERFRPLDELDPVTESVGEDVAMIG